MKIKYIATIALILIIGNTIAIVIAIPPPKEIIQNSKVIYVGILRETPHGFEFIVENTLKGKTPSEKVISFPDLNEEAFPLKYLTAKLGGKPTIFLGDLDSSGKLVPKYSNWSFWPQGIPESALPVGFSKEMKLNELIKHIQAITDKDQ